MKEGLKDDIVRGGKGGTIESTQLHSILYIEY